MPTNPKPVTKPPSPPVVAPPVVAPPVVAEPVGTKSNIEREVPQWLLLQAKSHLRNVWQAFRGPQYQLLSNFTRDLGVCVRSSAEIITGLELCIRAIRKTPLGMSWRDAPQQIRLGHSLTAALKPGAEYLPPFVLPVIKAGEDAGRLDDALEFLHHHCKLLASPASSLRNLWLFPVIVLAFGSITKVLIFLLMGSIGGAATTLLIEGFGWLQFVIIVAVIMLPPVKFFIDGVKLHAPFLGDFEKDIAMHRFFRIMALLYCVSGQRVEDMIRPAAEAVGNRAARIELLKAAKAIENKQSISDAFRYVTILSDEQKTTIEVGDMGGTLELAFEDISNKSGGSMVAKIGYVQPFLMRIVVFSTVLTIMGTIAMVAFSQR